MNTIRKDSKGRTLWSGEYQKPNGRYEYRYTDLNRKTKSVYSWRLLGSDRINPKYPNDIPLREIEKQINQQLSVGIDITKAHTYTLNDCFDKAAEIKSIRDQSKKQYQSTYNANVRDSIGNMTVDSIKRDNICLFLSKLLKNDTRSRDCVNTILVTIRFALKYAMDNDLISRNPCPTINEIPKYENIKKKQKRSALTEEEQIKLLNFVDEDVFGGNQKNLLIFLLGTGCRISEAVALTWEDCDMNNGTININHSAIIKKEDSGYILTISDHTKTESSERIIPMIPAVRKALEDEKERTKWIPSATIDGYTNFVFKTYHGNPIRRTAVDTAIKRMIQRYNKIETANAEKEKRAPDLLPNISAHILRHTFATRVYENEKDPNMLKNLLGHKHISTTMDVYTDSDAKKTRKKLESFGENLIYPERNSKEDFGAKERA